MATQKWIVASNRLPFKLDASGKKLEPGSGGLVTAITGIKSGNELLWVGVAPDGVDSKFWSKLSKPKGNKKFVPVFLETTTYDRYYNGMCNNVLWPLLHYESGLVQFEDVAWHAYAEANEAFAKAILEVASDGDLIWVHDFHLFMLPYFLKKENKTLKVGFFLHTPFPSSEVFRQLPVRANILESVLSSDLVGFHDYSYLRHFTSSIYHVLGLEANVLAVSTPNHTTQLGVFPVSIDTKYFSEESSKAEVKSLAKKIKTAQQFEHMVLGVDRLDYIKGISLKLLAFQEMLVRYPEMVGKVGLLQIAVPTRTDVADYIGLRQRIEQLVGQINGRFGRPNFVPVQYVYRSTGFEELLALYSLADVMLVTSKRDGMNLVSLEYVAAQPSNDPGVVVLSEFTGAISTLSHAIPTNPWDIESTAHNLYQALTMDRGERVYRHKTMLNYLMRYSATDWAESYMDSLARTGEVSVVDQTRVLKNGRADGFGLGGFIQKNDARRAVVFLDYDGTLVPIHEHPDLAVISDKERQAISSLICNENLELIIVSGRDRKFLSEQFAGIEVSIAAEHGARFFNHRNGKWRKLVRTDRELWYQKVKQVMSDYTSRVSGSFIERKRYCIAWHYRKSPVEFGEYQARKLKQDLEFALSHIPVSVNLGKKVVEVRALEANKGAFATWYLDYFFGDDNSCALFAIGDDETDEDMFMQVTSREGLAVKVGIDATSANYRLVDRAEVFALLGEIGDFAKRLA